MAETQNSRQCYKCGKNFFGQNSKRDFNRHLKMHEKAQKEVNLKCDICSKEYNIKKNFRRHLKMHEDLKKKRFECNICTKVFSSNGSFKKHLYTHSKVNCKYGKISSNQSRRLFCAFTNFFSC